MDTNPVTASAASTTPTTPQITIHPEPQNAQSLWSGQNQAPSFKDMLDVVNPLQQLPIIGSIYRAITGETMSSGSNLVGGVLYGGPIGLLGSIANEVVKTQTGDDIGGTLISALEGKSNTQVASNDDLSTTKSPAQLKGYNAYLQSQSLLT